MKKLSLLLFFLSFKALAFDWQGHRGARGLYPENTIGAMKEALKYPVTTLELDVVISKDMKVIVSHEPWMSSEICTDPKGQVVIGQEHNLYKLTALEIRAYDCGQKPHPRFPQQKKVSAFKPTLEDLLTQVETNLPYNIEIKSTPEDEKNGFQPDIKTFSDLVIRAVKKKLPPSRFTIQSFDWRVLRYLHKNYPEIRLVALTETTIDPARDLKRLGFKPHVYSPDFSTLEKKHVEYFQKEGIKVIPWTVNSVEDMKRVLSMKVDGIITDYPDRIKASLSSGIE